MPTLCFSVQFLNSFIKKGGGEIASRGDATLVYVSNSTQGDFSNWECYPLLFGDEASGGRNWEGKLSRVVIYSRFVGVEEAVHKGKLVQGE